MEEERKYYSLKAPKSFWKIYKNLLEAFKLLKFCFVLRRFESFVYFPLKKRQWALQTKSCNAAHSRKAQPVRPRNKINYMNLRRDNELSFSSRCSLSPLVKISSGVSTVCVNLPSASGRSGKSRLGGEEKLPPPPLRSCEKASLKKHEKLPHTSSSCSMCLFYLFYDTRRVYNIRS